MKWKLLVISSPTANERRAMVNSMLKDTNFDWQYIYADSNEINQLNYQPQKAIRHCGRELQKGELGCYASHYKCWQFLIDHQSYDYLMVLEDDVFIDTKFDFDELIQSINQCQIEYIRLYSRAFPANKLVGKLSLHRKIYRFKAQAYGTQCYLVSRAGATKLLSVADKGINRPVDDEMDRFWHNKLPNYAFFPYPAMEIEYQSTIRNKLPPVAAVGLDYIYYKFYQKIDGLSRRFVDIFFRVSDRNLKRILETISK